MPENSPQTLTCPSCSAPLEFDGSSYIVQCKFCKTTAILPSLPSQQAALSPNALAEIRYLAQGGNMMDAIRRYRELTKLGLKEAKEAVELLATGRVEEARLTISGPLTAEQVGQVLEQVQDLLRSGNKIEAIRRYREAADVSQTKARDVVERVDAALNGLPVPPLPEYEYREPQPTSPQVHPRRKPWFGVVVFLSILIFAGGLVALALFLPGGPFSVMLIANGPANLPVTWTSETGLVAAFYEIDDEIRLIGMLEPDNGELRWLSDPLPGEGYVGAIAQEDGLVYVASQNNLLAYHASNGSLAWQVVMPDRLNYGETNLLVASGRVLTMNLDQSIQAYDALSGVLVWSRRLAGYDRSLRMVGDSLMIFDYLGDDYKYSLIFLDPVDGREQRVLTPSCSTSEYSSDTPDPDAGFFYEKDEGIMYLVYDSSPGCIQRLDFTSGQPSWQTVDEEWYSFSPSGFTGLLTADQLYFSTGDRLLSVDKVTGQLHVLLTDEDNALIPLVVSGDTLIARVRRTRGSERFELRGLDTGSGELLWKMGMESAKPIDPPDEMVGLVDENDAGWTWTLTERGLIVIQFQAAPNQLFIQTVDPTDGSLMGEVTVPLKSVSGDFYSAPKVIAWVGDLIYFSLDTKIFCVNILTGEVIFHYQ